jgi:hypothetical protein
MLTNLMIAASMLIVTAAIHAAFMIFVLKLLHPHELKNWDVSFFRRFWAVTEAVLLMFCATVVEAAAWAGTYLALGAISGLERALYFSVVTFTSLGYGDIVLDEQWRLLASFQAANGIILFGWTTALAFAILRSMYVSRWLPQSVRD